MLKQGQDFLFVGFSNLTALEPEKNPIAPVAPFVGHEQKTNDLPRGSLHVYEFAKVLICENPGCNRRVVLPLKFHFEAVCAHHLFQLCEVVF